MHAAIITLKGKLFRGVERGITRMVDVVTQRTVGDGEQVNEPGTKATPLLPFIPLHEHTLPLAAESNCATSPEAGSKVNRERVQSEVMQLLTMRGRSSEPETRLSTVAHLIRHDPGALPATEEPSFLYHLSCVWGGIQKHAFRGTISMEPMAPELRRRARDAAQSVASRLDELGELDLVHFVRGTAYLKLWNVPDMQRAATLLAPRVAEMNCRTLSKVCDAFAVSGIRNPEFVEALKQRLNDPRSEDLNKYRGKDLARIAKYAGVVNLPKEDFEAPIASLAERLLPVTAIAHRMEIGWGLTALESAFATAYVGDVLKHAKQLGMRKLNTVLQYAPYVRLQFFQACLDLHLEPGKAFNGFMRRTTSILEPVVRESRRENESARSSDTKPRRTEENEFEQEMKTVLMRLCGPESIIRSQPTIGGISVDFEVGMPISGHQGAYKMFIVECDGVRYHYVNSDPEQGCLGEHRMRQRILSKRGHAVVRVTSDEWNSCESRVKLMREKFQEAYRAFCSRRRLVAV